MKVIYIDDEVNTEKMASKFEILRESDIELIPVENVRDALPTIEKYFSEIDLVVLDVIMPPEDHYGIEETNGGTTTGLRLLKDIRTKFKTLPIIIVSVRRRQVSEGLLKQMNVAEYLEKPILAAEIAEAIKRVLTKAQ